MTEIGLRVVDGEFLIVSLNSESGTCTLAKLECFYKETDIH